MGPFISLGRLTNLSCTSHCLMQESSVVALSMKSTKDVCTNKVSGGHCGPNRTENGTLPSRVTSLVPEGEELPKWLSSKEPACQYRRHGFDPWVGKISWKRKWQLSSVFLPGKCHGQKNLACYSPWGHRFGHGWATRPKTTTRSR